MRNHASVKSSSERNILYRKTSTPASASSESINQRVKSHRERRKLEQMSIRSKKLFCQSSNHSDFFFSTPSQDDILEATEALKIDLEDYVTYPCVICSCRCLKGDLANPVTIPFLQKKLGSSVRFYGPARIREDDAKNESDTVLSQPTIEDELNALYRICIKCSKQVVCGRLPRFNFHTNFFGQVPVELQELTFLEELLICRYRCVSYVIRLNCGAIPQRNLLQRALKGNCFIFLYFM